MADRVDGQCNHIQLLRLVRYSVEVPIGFGEWKCRECNEVLALALPAAPPTKGMMISDGRKQAQKDAYMEGYNRGFGDGCTHSRAKAEWEAVTGNFYKNIPKEPAGASATPAPSEPRDICRICKTCKHPNYDEGRNTCSNCGQPLSPTARELEDRLAQP